MKHTIGHIKKAPAKQLFQLMNIIWVLIFYSCQATYKQEIILINDLGKIELTLPTIFDTIYTWEDIGDHTCGDYNKIRIANQNFSLLAETGWLYDETIDSLFQITVIQHIEPCCGFQQNNNRLKNSDEWLKQEVLRWQAKDPETIVIDSQLKKIDNFEFAVITFKNIRSNKTYIEIYAKTIIHNHTFVIKSECLSMTNCKEFDKIILNILNNLQIKVTDSTTLSSKFPCFTK